MYKFLQRDFEVALEYVALDRNHLSVYSTRLANLILRSGPEILRLLYLLIFYPREKLAPIEPETTRIMLEIQDKIENRRDTFGDYLDMLTDLGNDCVRVATLEGYAVPFEIEKRDGHDRVFWWEDGYNALRHRAIREFEKSATLKHTLYALASLWVLHHHLRLVLNNPPFYGIIKEDMPGSDLFSDPMDRKLGLSMEEYGWENLRNIRN